jgi:hypothetical protein
VDQRLDIQQQRIEEQAQTKVETSQKFPIRVAGMALFNAFLNSKQSGGNDYPVVAAAPGPGNSGATVRQTIIGLEFGGPRTIWGGKVSGSVYMDFFAGATNSAMRRVGFQAHDGRIFDALTGGMQVWPTPPVTCASITTVVSDGLFTICPGEPNDPPIATDVFGATGGGPQPRWIEISTGGQPMQPRIELHTAPYASRVGFVDNAELTDTVELGGARLTARLTPGHTKGCTTWTTRVQEGGRTLDVVIIGSPNVNAGYKLVNNSLYPQIASEYERMFRVLKSLPCDVFLGAHGNYYGMEDKFARMSKGGSNPFIDPDGYKRYVAEREKTFRSEFERQTAASK